MARHCSLVPSSYNTSIVPSVFQVPEEVRMTGTCRTSCCTFHLSHRNFHCLDYAPPTKSLPTPLLSVSTAAREASTSTATSSSATRRPRAPRPSSTCARCAAASRCPRASTSWSRPPSSPTKTETSASGCSPRSRLTSSE